MTTASSGVLLGARVAPRRRTPARRDARAALTPRASSTGSAAHLRGSPSVAAEGGTISAAPPPRDASALLPPRAGARENLVASVAASAPASAPPETVSPFVAFCRANWGYFAALQTVALIGASFNGRLARVRRLEIAEINAKLRAMRDKYESEQAATRPDADDDDFAGPAYESLAEGKAALAAGDFEAAVGAFSEAKARAGEDDFASLSAKKGVAAALARAGQLRAAIAELETAIDQAVTQGDGSVFGTLGDLHADLAELKVAGEYYDKCLAMD